MKWYFRLVVLFVFVVFKNTLSLAQPVDISGNWAGNSYFLGTRIFTEYDINQRGASISGFIKTKNGTDSAKTKFEGTIKESRITLKGTEFVYKVGSACLSKAELTFSDNNGFTTLNGRWKGTLDLNTCPPGVSGRVELSRSIPSVGPIVPPQATDVATDKISPNDFEGTELIKALAERKYYALVIAVEDYEDQDIQDLDNPVDDATGLLQVLNTYYTFDQEYTFVLKNPDRSQIIEAFDKLETVVEERDNVLIFFAGHGIWDERLQQGFWLPSNAKMSSKAQWISNSTIRDYIGGIRSKHTLLIADACFGGSIFKERAVYNNSKAILEMYRLPSRKAMTSGALKTVPDKSVFIRYLNKNLQTNTRPLLSAEQLFQAFKIAVINNSPNGQVPQYGPIGQAGDEGGDFIFLKKGAQQQVK